MKIARFFALPLRSFSIFSAKITGISILLLFSLYQGLSYWRSLLESRVQKAISAKTMVYNTLLEQKKWAQEREIIALCTDRLRLQLKQQLSHGKFDVLYAYAKQTGVSISSYQENQYAKKDHKKETQSYTLQGTQKQIIDFLKLLEQKKYPAYGISLKITQYQNEQYQLQLVLKTYRDYQVKIPSTCM